MREGLEAGEERGTTERPEGWYYRQQEVAGCGRPGSP